MAGSGSTGSIPAAGGLHHHRILLDKFHPGYLGKVGMRYFHKSMYKSHCPVVNVDKLFSLLPDPARHKSREIGDAGSGRALPIDVSQFGFFKVLGKGEAPPAPLLVKAKFFSKLTEKKIKDARGAVVLTA